MSMKLRQTLSDALDFVQAVKIAGQAGRIPAAEVPPPFALETALREALADLPAHPPAPEPPRPALRVIIPEPDRGTGRQKGLRGWWKHATGANRKERGGYAIEGAFLDAGERLLPEGAVVVRADIDRTVALYVVAEGDTGTGYLVPAGWMPDGYGAGKPCLRWLNLSEQTQTICDEIERTRDADHIDGLLREGIAHRTTRGEMGHAAELAGVLAVREAHRPKSPTESPAC